MLKGQRQELRFVCWEYRGLEVLCAQIAKSGSILLGTVCNGDRDFWQLRCNPLRGNNLKKGEM